MTDGNDPAFANSLENGWSKGLTIREYFAGLALQALLSKRVPERATTNDIAELAIACADALIAELNKEQ